MTFFIKIKEDKITSTDFSKLFGTLDNGEYKVIVQRVNEQKLPIDYQREYFANLDAVKYYTGNSKQELHSMFKDYRDEKDLFCSTKNLTVEQWHEWNDSFRHWIFENLEIII